MLAQFGRGADRERILREAANLNDAAYRERRQEAETGDYSKGLDAVERAFREAEAYRQRRNRPEAGSVEWLTKGGPGILEPDESPWRGGNKGRFGPHIPGTPKGALEGPKARTFHSPDQLKSFTLWTDLGSHFGSQAVGYIFERRFKTHLKAGDWRAAVADAQSFYDWARENLQPRAQFHAAAILRSALRHRERHGHGNEQIGTFYETTLPLLTEAAIDDAIESSPRQIRKGLSKIKKEFHKHLLPAIRSGDWAAAAQTAMKFSDSLESTAGVPVQLKAYGKAVLKAIREGAPHLPPSAYARRAAMVTAAPTTPLSSATQVQT